METSLTMVSHSYRFMRDEFEEESMNEEWKDMTAGEKEAFRMYMRILQGSLCSICKDVQPNRVILCENGHSICVECSTKVSRCGLCRGMLESPIPMRGLEDVVKDIQDKVLAMIHFRHGEAVDVYLRPEGWVEGRILLIDYEIMSFFVSAGKKILNRPFFSSRIARIHTYTPEWRNMETLVLGKKIEVQTDQFTWVAGVVVLRDVLYSEIHVAYRYPTMQIKTEAFCIYNSERIARYPTHLLEEESHTWVEIS